MQYTGFNALTANFGAGALNVVNTIAGTVTINTGYFPQTVTSPVNIVSVYTSQASQLSINDQPANDPQGNDTVNFNASTWPLAVNASLADASSTGPTDLTGFGPIGSVAFTGFGLANLDEGTASGTLSLDVLSALTVNAYGGAANATFDVYHVGSAANSFEAPVAMEIKGNSGNDTTNVIIPDSPANHPDLLHLSADVAHLVVDNTAYAGAVNWETVDGSLLDYGVGTTSTPNTPLLNIAQAGDVNIEGGSSANNHAHRQCRRAAAEWHHRRQQGDAPIGRPGPLHVPYAARSLRTARKE